MAENTPKNLKSLRKLDEDSYQDPNTGEVFSKANTNWIFTQPKKRSLIKEDFMLAFQEEFAGLAQKRLSGMEYSVLLLLLATADYDCTTTIPQKEIAERLGCKQQMVSRAIQRLTEEELIKSSYKRGYISVYYVNPWLCIRGDEKNRKAIIKQWDLL